DSLTQIFLKLIVNEVNIGAHTYDVFVYVDLGNDQHTVGCFRTIDLIVNKAMAQIALWIKIHAQQTFVVAYPETDSQILRNGGLTGAAFLIDKGKHFGRFFMQRSDQIFTLKPLR